MFCPKCGNPIGDEAIKCSQCGWVNLADIGSAVEDVEFSEDGEKTVSDFSGQIPISENISSNSAAITPPIANPEVPLSRTMNLTPGEITNLNRAPESFKSFGEEDDERTVSAVEAPVPDPFMTPNVKPLYEDDAVNEKNEKGNRKVLVLVICLAAAAILSLLITAFILDYKEVVEIPGIHSIVEVFRPDETEKEDEDDKNAEDKKENESESELIIHPESEPSIFVDDEVESSEPSSTQSPVESQPDTSSDDSVLEPEPSVPSEPSEPDSNDTTSEEPSTDDGDEPLLTIPDGNGGTFEITEEDIYGAASDIYDFFTQQ